MDSNNYDINTFSTNISLTTTEAAALVSPSIIPNHTIAGIAVTLVFNFTLAHSIPSTGVIYVVYPNQVTLNSSALLCNCTDSTSSTSTCSCIHETVGGRNRITITNAFTSGLSASESVQLTIQGFNNSQDSDTTSSFIIETYTDVTNLYKIDKADSNLTLTSN